MAHVESGGSHPLGKWAEGVLVQDGNLPGDSVNHPPHYKGLPNGIETIDVTEWFNFNRGNAIKYTWRAGLKDKATEIEDLEKARWYLDREIIRLKEIPGQLKLF